MISRLHGTVMDKQAPTALIDVQGVGYDVDLPLNTFFQLPPVGQPVTLWTHLTIREDAHQLFGFTDREQLRCFRLLIKVNGVGPKLALAILSGLEVSALQSCIAREDIATLVRVPGVGKKTAERLVIELRDRLGRLDLTGSAETLRPLQQAASETPRQEAELALLALGYKPAEAQKALKSLEGTPLETADLVRAALKGLLRT